MHHGSRGSVGDWCAAILQPTLPCETLRDTTRYKPKVSQGLIWAEMGELGDQVSEATPLRTNCKIRCSDGEASSNRLEREGESSSWRDDGNDNDNGPGRKAPSKRPCQFIATLQ